MPITLAYLAGENGPEGESLELLFMAFKERFNNTPILILAPRRAEVVEDAVRAFNKKACPNEGDHPFVQFVVIEKDEELQPWTDTEEIGRTSLTTIDSEATVVAAPEGDGTDPTGGVGNLIAEFCQFVVLDKDEVCASVQNNIRSALDPLSTTAQIRFEALEEQKQGITVHVGNSSISWKDWPEGSSLESGPIGSEEKPKVAHETNMVHSLHERLICQEEWNEEVGAFLRREAQKQRSYNYIPERLKSVWGEPSDYSVYMLNLREDRQEESHRPHCYPKAKKHIPADGQPDTFKLIEELQSFCYVALISLIAKRLNAKHRSPLRRNQRGMFYAVLAMGLAWLGFSIGGTLGLWSYLGYLMVLVVFLVVRSQVEGSAGSGKLAGRMRKHLFYLVMQESFRYEFYLDLAQHDPSESKLLHNRHDPEGDFLRESLIFVGARSRALKADHDAPNPNHAERLEEIKHLAPHWVEKSWVRGQLDYHSKRLHGIPTGWPWAVSICAEILNLPNYLIPSRATRNHKTSFMVWLRPLLALVCLLAGGYGAFHGGLFVNTPFAWPLASLGLGIYFLLGSLLERFVDVKRDEYQGFRMGYRQKDQIFTWLTRLLHSFWLVYLFANVPWLPVKIVILSFYLGFVIYRGYHPPPAPCPQRQGKIWAEFLPMLSLLLGFGIHFFWIPLTSVFTSNLIQSLTGFFLMAYILMTSGKRAIAMSEMVDNAERMIRLYESCLHLAKNNPEWFDVKVAEEMTLEALKEVSDWKKLRRQHGDIFQPS